MAREEQLPFRDEQAMDYRGPAVESGDAGERRVRAGAVITAAVLRAGRGTEAETFAARGGACLGLAAGLEAGARMPWDVPVPELNALAQALGPELGEMLWTASMCDLLVANMLGGDLAGAGIVAADVAGDPAQRGTARALLRWAVQGIAPGVPPLLAGAERDVLRRKAAELAGSGTDDAQVGAELLALFPPVTPAR